MPWTMICWGCDCLNRNLSNENGTGSLTVRLRSEPYGTVSLKLAADNDTFPEVKCPELSGS